MAFVKSACRMIGFAEFQEDARDCGAAEFVEGREKEGGSDTFAAEITMDGDIQDFRFVRDLAGGQEAEESSVCFTD